ncbi:MAG TPA: response regulator, partial [Vicinamibacterales bacterium]|nr:response regulator [Vicinamibacterales bacterium]
SRPVAIESASGPVARRLSSPALHHARIVVADDNADMREYLQRILGERYEVDAVGDGAMALEHVRANPPDLVLADVMMPQLDGFELLKTLRESDTARAIPVILLSARAGEESRIEGLEAGADDYLVKPFSAREMLARVASQLQLARLRRESGEKLDERLAELEAANGRLDKAAERQSLLWDAAAIMLSTDDPDRMVRGLFEKVSAHLGTDAYFNFLVNAAGDALHLMSCAGIPEETARTIQRLDFGQAVCGTVAVQRRPIVATHIQDSDDPKVQLVKSFGIRSYACNPLLAENRLIGTLSFASRTKDSFEPEEVAFIETLCQYITMAYERLRLLERLRDGDRRKDEFIAMLAHELRNPLFPVRNALQLLRLSDGKADVIETARGVMERQVAQMVRLVDDLLDVARITRGKLELKRERVELAALVRQAVETSRPLIEQMAHELEILLPDEPVQLDADAVRVTQILLNLLNNAAKYTEPGGHIALTATCESGDIVISVRDTGIGIPADKLPHIFEIFAQVEPPLDRSQGGLGLGLTLVKRLAELHGGSVEARSYGSGRGSTFTVRLPIARGDAAPVDGSALRAPASTSGHRILIVDDNRDGANSLAMVLRMLGNQVFITYDGIAALQAAEAYRPGLVLLDIGLPRMNGHEVCRSIRGSPWGADMILVAVTGWGQEEDRRQSLDVGFDYHLVKPVNPADLEKILADEPRLRLAGRSAGQGAQFRAPAPPRDG